MISLTDFITEKLKVKKSQTNDDIIDVTHNVMQKVDWKLLESEASPAETDKMFSELYSDASGFSSYNFLDWIEKCGGSKSMNATQYHNNMRKYGRIVIADDEDAIGGVYTLIAIDKWPNMSVKTVVGIDENVYVLMINVSKRKYIVLDKQELTDVASDAIDAGKIYNPYASLGGNKIKVGGKEVDERSLISGEYISDNVSK